MLKYFLTAIFLGLLLCLLYQPIALPDDDSAFDKYRPSFNLLHDRGHNETTDKKADVASGDLQKDSSTLKNDHILVDTTP